MPALVPGRAVELLLREGFVDEEFIDLARAGPRRGAGGAADRLKRALAERVLARPADEVVELSAR